MKWPAKIAQVLPRRLIILSVIVLGCMGIGGVMALFYAATHVFGDVEREAVNVSGDEAKSRFAAASLVPKLCLGTHRPKLRFVSFSAHPAAEAGRSRASNPPLPSRAWERVAVRAH